MAYVIKNPEAGYQPIAVTDTTQNHPLGTVVRATDSTYGEGEFIYLQGVASTIVGSVVTYTATYQTALCPTTANLPAAVAFAMSANVAGPNYGWYQISGVAIAAKTSALALASNVAVGVKTAGLISATSAGVEIQGAMTVAKATTPKTVKLMINRPHHQGRIT